MRRAHKTQARHNACASDNWRQITFFDADQQDTVTRRSVAGKSYRLLQAEMTCLRNAWCRSRVNDQQMSLLQDRIDAIDTAINSIEDDLTRLVARLYYIEGRTEQETAAYLSTHVLQYASRSTVHLMVKRAARQIADKMQKRA